MLPCAEHLCCRVQSSYAAVCRALMLPCAEHLCCRVQSTYAAVCTASEQQMCTASAVSTPHVAHHHSQCSHTCCAATPSGATSPKELVKQRSNAAKAGKEVEAAGGPAGAARPPFGDPSSQRGLPTAGPVMGPGYQITNAIPLSGMNGMPASNFQYQIMQVCCLLRRSVRRRCMRCFCIACDALGHMCMHCTSVTSSCSGSQQQKLAAVALPCTASQQDQLLCSSPQSVIAVPW
jgi:hypothetical protein